MNEKKVREAISCINDLIPLMPSVDRSAVEHLETAIEALEKQLAKKPQIYGEFKDEIDFNCPECGKAFVMEKADVMQCCPYCECKFDWSE